MENIFQQVELVVFDLDGTLYEDTDHFEYYAEQLKKELPEELHTAFDEEYERMVEGAHIVTIGRVYDVARDTILQLNPESLLVEKAWTWEGQSLTENELNDRYPQPIQMDFDTMIAVGDGWWLPAVCARHFGVKDTQNAYVATKDFMATDQFKLTKIPNLRKALLNLKEKKQVILLTNSEKDDVHRLLRNLDLDGIFGENIITSARKPQFTKNHFEKIIEEKQLQPELILSIGDNYINEIAPAINLGMKTVFIDFYDLEYKTYHGMKVKSISELVDLMLDI